MQGFARDRIFRETIDSGLDGSGVALGEAGQVSPRPFGEEDLWHALSMQPSLDILPAVHPAGLDVAQALTDRTHGLRVREDLKRLLPSLELVGRHDKRLWSTLFGDDDVFMVRGHFINDL